jgi:hypothetical protein
MAGPPGVRGPGLGPRSGRPDYHPAVSPIRYLRLLLTLITALAGCRPSSPDDPPAGAGRAPAADPAPDPWAVRLDGIGPLRFGMPTAEVRAALHDTLGPPPPSDQCVWMVPASVPVGVRLMLEQGHLVRLDVDSAGIRTERGGEVGMTRPSSGTGTAAASSCGPTSTTRPHAI